MKTASLFALALIFIGCSSTQQIPLNEIQTNRVFKLSRGDVFETVRFFTIREEYRIDSFEEETGRVIAHKVLTPRRGEDPKTIIMNLKVLRVEDNVTEVNARFAYYEFRGELKKNDEAELADAYLNLFHTLESRE